MGMLMILIGSNRSVLFMKLLKFMKFLPWLPDQGIHIDLFFTLKFWIFFNLNKVRGYSELIMNELQGLQF